jgi:ubiquinone/menaquinone biosynthesis C-methylase UbiE
VDLLTQRKWDRAARTFDLMNGFGPELRWGPAKRRLFARMQGRILFVAVGTGLDIPFFPPHQTIVAIDVSPKMIERAQVKAQRYHGSLELKLADVQALDEPDATFDQVFTSCTFCSVPDPLRGLHEVRRVLKPGGELHMFEHTGSRYFPFNVMLHALTPLSRKAGPDLDRDTIGNVQRAGFRVTGVERVFLDVVNAIHAASV